MYYVILLCFFLVSLPSCSMRYDEIIYHDQNNNKYKILKDSIFYAPIQKEVSSSGLYSGGRPKAISISQNQYTTLLPWVHKIIDDKTYHSDKRIMTSSTMSVKSKGVVTTYLLLPSLNRQNFEKELNMLLTLISI